MCVSVCVCVHVCVCVCMCGNRILFMYIYIHMHRYNIFLKCVAAADQVPSCVLAFADLSACLKLSSSSLKTVVCMKYYSAAIFMKLKYMYVYTTYLID